MVDCFNEIAADPECRVVVVSGAGKIFTAGGFQVYKCVLFFINATLCVINSLCCVTAQAST